jgi:hypothetical protein
LAGRTDASTETREIIWQIGGRIDGDHVVAGLVAEIDERVNELDDLG